MGFDIKPGMTIWNSTSEKYKKEYHIYAAKMEKRKFENDRKLVKVNRNNKKSLKGLNKKSSEKEKNWFSWMI